jgi:carbamate kinase
MKRKKNTWLPGLKKNIVVALGGNAIQKANTIGTAEEQIENLLITCHHIVELIKSGHRITITHGNGPQIGNLLIQQEEGEGKVPAQPMHCCGAMTQGQIGYMLQQTLGNLLKTAGISRDVLTVITQILVDSKDPSFQNPTKPVGPCYDAETKKSCGVKGRPLQRLVPSPNPLEIVEAKAIRSLVEAGVIVVASGGGGIPVKMDSRGHYQGVNAVIDKDLAAEKLAEVVGADILLILTDVEKVYLNFRTSRQKGLKVVHLEDARCYLKHGHFSPGSMAPKVESCTKFLEFGGEMAIVTAIDKLRPALQGKTGTQFLP